MKSTFCWRKCVTMLATLLPLGGCAPPMGDLCSQRERNAAHDVWEIRDGCCVPDRPLTLVDVLHVALNNNLDFLVQYQDECVQQKLAESACQGLLPRMDLDAEVSHRSKPSATIFRNLTTGTSSPGTTSSTQTTNRWNLNVAFDMLDLGVKYFRARQQTKQVAVKWQENLRMRQNILLELVRKYWTAMATQKMLVDAEEMLERVEKRVAILEEHNESRILPALFVLREEKALLDMRQALTVVQYEWENARQELSGLMGIPLCTDYTLADIEEQEIPRLVYDLCELEDAALHCRPELFVHDLNEQIKADEARATLVQMLPGNTAFNRFSTDRNDQTVFKEWVTAGWQLAWKIFDLPSLAKKREAAQMEEELVTFQRMAESVVVVTQVNLADVNYKRSLRELEIAKEYLTVNEALLETAHLEFRSGDISHRDVLDIEYDTLIAHLEAWKAYAEVQIAVEQINNSIGDPFYYGPIDQEEVCDLIPRRAAERESEYTEVCRTPVRLGSLPNGHPASRCVER